MQCVTKYVPKEPDELALEESDVVNVFKKLEDGKILSHVPTAEAFSLTLYVQMDSSFWFSTVNLGWSIVYKEGS